MRFVCKSVLFFGALFWILAVIGLDPFHNFATSHHIPLTWEQISAGVTGAWTRSGEWFDARPALRPTLIVTLVVLLVAGRK